MRNVSYVHGGSGFGVISEQPRNARDDTASSLRQWFFSFFGGLRN